MSKYKVILTPTGQLQFISAIDSVHFKDRVANQAALPLSGNALNDARVVDDTGHYYIWSKDASTGILSDWIDNGDFIDLTWGAISGKPSSSVADIDDAVSKKHTQGTDLLTINEQLNSYLLVLSDNGKLIDMNKAIGVGLSVPENASVPFSIGTLIAVRQKGLGAVTIIPMTNVTIISSESLTTPNQYSIITLLKVDTNIWTVTGTTELHTQNTDTGTNGNFDIVGELSIKVYSQNSEPTLGEDNRLALWIDTSDDNRTYLIFRRPDFGSGFDRQIKVELA
jgi:hypothetical protein